MKIGRVVAELRQWTDGQTDRRHDVPKLLDPFCSYANVPKNVVM
jgi:hypothetical protein